MITLLIGVVIGLVPGAVASYLVLRKNGKIKAELDALTAKVAAKL